MKHTLLRHSRGAVMAEMLLAFPAVLLMFLAVAQSSLLSVGHLVVRHAAQRAARTAIVVLEDDPIRYGGQARGEISPLSPPPASATQALPITSNNNTSVEQMVRALVDRDASRLNAIRAAAYLPLSLIAPAVWLVGRVVSLRGAVDHSLLGQLTSGLLYNFAGAAITFPSGPGAKKARTVAYGPTDEVTVRVTYLFRCEVPIAAALMCDQLGELLLGVSYEGALGTWRGRRGLLSGAQQSIQGQERITRQAQAMEDLKQVEAPALQKILALTPGRYTTITAEATLPIAGAHYYPRQP